MTQGCPTTYGIWTGYDLLDKKVTDAAEFYHNQFANDELQLINMRTYYVEVEVQDAINRTFRARSNGVTIRIDPPAPGAVRDGPYHGEDRSYQQSTEELSANWDDFGSDEPGLRITRYEVAIGDHPAYATSRSNVHYYVDVGLGNNYTFIDLRLIPKEVVYYVTVRGFSESGAFVDSTSNGIRAGYRAGMLAGEVERNPYSNSSTTLSASWSGFLSAVDIENYHWGISSSPLTDPNVTLLCTSFLKDIKSHFDVMRLTNVRGNTYAERRLLDLKHNTEYFVTVIAEDQAGWYIIIQNTCSSECM